MQKAFLDASFIRNQKQEAANKFVIKQEGIRFEFPDGFNQLRIIEECRALNALDISDPDNFDFMFDIMMQMLVGKVVFVYFIDENEIKNELAHFVITNRYMDLRSIDILDEYPVLINWLVEFITGYLGKKYPRSLKEVQATMNEKRELMKKTQKNRLTMKSTVIHS